MSTSKTWPGGATNTAAATYTIPAAGELSWASLSDFLNALGDSAQSTTLQKFAVRKCTTSPVTVAATTDCVIITQLAVAGAVTVNLPAGATKQVFFITDGTGDASTNTVTINRAGSDTIAGGTSITLTTNREGVLLVYNVSDTDWKIAGRFISSAFANPMDSAGDMIYGGASGVPTKLDSGSSGTILTSGGAAIPVWTAITDAQFYATSSTAGTVSATTQTLNGLKTFDDGIAFTQTASSGTGVTVNGSTCIAYEEITLVTTLSNFNATPPAITLKATRSGKVVSICVSATVSDASKSNTSDPATVDALPTPFRPAQSLYLPWYIRNNSVYQLGVALVGTNGIITFQLASLGAWTGSAPADIMRSSGSYTLL